MMVFSAYFLVPFFMTFLFRQFNIKSKGLTYLITGLLILIYPFVLFWVRDLINPTISSPRCANPEVAFIFGNTIFFLPITLFIQYLFNRSYL
jgi:hypothetical protein